MYGECIDLHTLPLSSTSLKGREKSWILLPPSAPLGACMVTMAHSLATGRLAWTDRRRVMIQIYTQTHEYNTMSDIVAGNSIWRFGQAPSTNRPILLMTIGALQLIS